MTIDFTCRKCDSSFEIEAQDLIDGTEKLVCPHCDAKAPAALVDDFVSALTEMRTQVTNLGKKFGVNVSLETEELEDLKAEEEEEADEDEDEDEDDDELDFDEDEDEEIEDEDADEA